MIKPLNNVDKWMRYEDDIIKYYYPSLMDWIQKGCKAPQTSFTAGLGRQIALLIWDVKAKEEIKQRDAIQQLIRGLGSDYENSGMSIANIRMISVARVKELIVNNFGKELTEKRK